MEGVSLVPAFADRTPDRGAIYIEHEGSRAVMDGSWKAVARGSTGPWELYDTELDRTETRDLAARQPGELARLTAHVGRLGESGPGVSAAGRRIATYLRISSRTT